MNACEVKDNSDWILIKYPHPPKSPSWPLPPTCHINTPITRPDEWKWTELWCDSPSVKSIPPILLPLPSYFPPSLPLPPHPFLCSFPILLFSVEAEELTCVWQREIYTRRQEVLSLSAPPRSFWSGKWTTLASISSLFTFKGVYNSHSRHEDSVSETKSACGDGDKVMSK